MKVHSLVQGTPAWLEFRERVRPASESSALMGESPYKSRQQLMHERATGEREVVTPFKQKIFDKGHVVEETCRPSAAARYFGDEIFPATVSDDDEYLSASLDGMTMDGSKIWEHKQFNQRKVDHIEEFGTVPMQDYWQVQQQLLITGAEMCIYTVGNDPDEMLAVEVHPDPDAQEKLVAAWRQFDEDLLTYVPPAKAEQVDDATLPALVIEVTGSVVASNLDEYKDAALSVFESIAQDLQTDQDFADAEEATKWCKEIEAKLKSAKEAALRQTSDIDALFSAIDEIAGAARDKRLALDKLVKQRKESRKLEILEQGVAEVGQHIVSLNERLNKTVMLMSQEYRQRIQGAMKNKRTIKSLMDAAGQVVADLKIELSAEADRAQINLAHFLEVKAPEAIFPDLDVLLRKDPDDFIAVVQRRMTEADLAKAQVVEGAPKKVARTYETPTTRRHRIVISGDFPGSREEFENAVENALVDAGLSATVDNLEEEAA